MKITVNIFIICLFASCSEKKANKMKRSIQVFFTFISMICSAQEASISYESHGRTTTLESNNPFAKFIGEWTLKDDEWTQNWGGQTETIKIPKHHTVSARINTENSLISIIDGPEPNGHIFWTYNPVTKEVEHLSSFGESRTGVGKGTVNENGDVTLKISFEGEPEGTYRLYTYKWVDANEYDLMSVQYNAEDEPTGNFYGGTFIRVQRTKKEQGKEEILNHGEVIRKAFSESDIEKIKSLHHPEVVKALGYNDIKNGRDEVMEGLEGTLDNYNLEFIENDVESILMQDNMAIEQTRFVIKGTPKQGGEPFIFKGRTMVTYVRYDKSPTGWATIREIIQPAME